MRIVLLQDIRGLGRKLEIKEVNDGYARNFLFPKKLAKLAEEKLVKDLEKQKEVFRQEQEISKKAAELTARNLKEKEFNFYVKTGKGGEVFGSVNEKDIKKSLKETLGFLSASARKKMEEKIKIQLPRPLKNLGSHNVKVLMGEEGIATDIKVLLKPESER